MIGRVVCTLPALAFLTVAAPLHVFAAEPVHKPHQRETNRSEIRKIFLDQIQATWVIPADLPHADKVRVRALLKLDRSGGLAEHPRVTATGGSGETRRALVASAYRSILRAAPFRNLPNDRYNDWREVVLNFDASDPCAIMLKGLAI